MRPRLRTAPAPRSSTSFDAGRSAAYAPTVLRVTASRVWGLVCSGALLFACGSQPTATPVATAVPAPVPLDPRAGARCVVRQAANRSTPVPDERMVAVTLGPHGPRWVSSHQVWDAIADAQQGLPTGVALAQGLSVLAYMGEGYLAVTSPSANDATGRNGLAVIDGALRAGRVVHGRNVASVLCGAAVSETPTGAVLAYYAPEGGACGGSGEEHVWFVQRLDARGDGRGPAVVVGAIESDPRPTFSAVHPRWESGRVLLAVNRAGQSYSMVLADDLRPAVQQRGSLVCARAGCARFAVEPRNAVDPSGAERDSSAGTVRMDVLGYQNTFALGVDADEILDARANGDFALIVFRGRVNTAETSRGVAVVNVPLRRLETVYDSDRGASALTWAESAPESGGVFVRTTERGFALGAGGHRDGTLMNRAIECSR